jgi:hypothetical protein
MREELKKAFAEGTLYDFIANNYYAFTKDELKELILNLDWVATEGMNDAQTKEFYKTVEEELENRDFWAE